MISSNPVLPKSEVVCGKIDQFLSMNDVRRYQNVDFGLYLENGAIRRAHKARNILFGFFFCQRGNILRHFMCLISESRLKGYSE